MDVRNGMVGFAYGAQGDQSSGAVQYLQNEAQSGSLHKLELWLSKQVLL
jgi:hypothetical protein